MSVSRFDGWSSIAVRACIIAAQVETAADARAIADSGRLLASADGQLRMRIVVWCVVMLVRGAPTLASAQTSSTTVRVEVRSEAGPVGDATVSLHGRSLQTDAQGSAAFDVAAGRARLTVHKEGFVPASLDLAVTGRELPVIVNLQPEPQVEEEVVVVASTRTGRRLEDQPTRVEVLGREEIEEKMLMTPGDIVMMLNEMGGLRVQATSPSIGAASVRVQGMKGRYTRFLSDGLPLFGQQVGGLGLLQIPPMDLGQVEVIKGTASALYGAGAMGGVVNLLSRRPGREPYKSSSSTRRRSGAPMVSPSCHHP